MNWQHRHGAPARTRAHDHTVWECEPIRPIRELVGGAFVVALFCLVLLGAAVVVP